jgi:hypothetical protein
LKIDNKKRRAFALLLVDVYYQLADWIFTISRWNFFTSLLKKTRGSNIVPECSTHIVVIGAKLVLTHRENICRDVGDRASIFIDKRKSEVAVGLILVLLYRAGTVVCGLNLHHNSLLTYYIE